jgi:hypothetical protein
MSTTHVYVDETKARDYVVVAASIVSADVGPVRRQLNDLTLPGQRRLHMKDERDSRKRAIADQIAAMPVKANVYVAGRTFRTDLERRARCLDQLVTDLPRQAAVELVIELDDTLLRRDRQVIIESSRRRGLDDLFRYRHERAAAEPLLAIPDAIAWCWAKGQHWAALARSNRARDREHAPALTCAKPERRGRPAGSRAHFLRLTAPG